MAILLILAVSLAPGIFWLWFFYKKDKLEPEPRLFVILVFLLGALAAVPAFILELPFSTFSFFSVVIVAPLLEEVLKFLAVRFTIYRHDEFDEPMDGIVYAAAVALGFASAENPLYLINTYISAREEIEGLQAMPILKQVGGVFLVRALLAVPGHALWSSMWGYALGRARFMGNRTRDKARIISVGLVLAVFFHALHNFLAAFISEFAPVAVFFLALLLWKIVFRNMDLALADSPFAEGADGVAGLQGPPAEEPLRVPGGIE